MEQTIKVNYKSIFKYESHQESVSYHEVGTLISSNEGKVISFFHEEGHIEIGLFDQHISLKNGNSSLKLVQDRKTLNQYHTEYGVMDLTTRLVSMDTSNGVKIKYHLYDGDNKISEVYILLTYIVLEN